MNKNFGQTFNGGTVYQQIISDPTDYKENTKPTTFFSPQPLSITDVSIWRLNASHKVSSRSQLADKGLVQRLAEIRWIVVCVSNSRRDANVTVEGRVSAVCRSDNEVVALDELIVKQACQEYHSTVTVNVEIVCAVVDVRYDLVTHNSILLWVLVLSKHLQGE